MKSITIKPTKAQVEGVKSGRIKGSVLAKKLGCSVPGLWLALKHRHGYIPSNTWHRVKLSKQDIAAYNRGEMTVAEIAKKHKASQGTIRTRLALSGVKKKWKDIRGARHAKKAAKRRDRLAALYGSGKSIRELSKAEGLSPQRVSQILSGTFGGAKSGMRPIWCKKCKAKMFGSRFVVLYCPACSNSSAKKATSEK